MSYIADGAYDVYDERHVRAHKEHRCGACNETIEIGHTYWRIGVVFDRSAETHKRCERCQKIHVHLRDLGDPYDMLWPDENLNCGEEYRDHWGEEPPEEIAALAFVRPQDLQ